MLTVERNGPVATIVLDNQPLRNAMTQEMWRQFPPILTALDADDAVKVVVVRGAGAHFSAGADIAALERILHDPSTGLKDGGDITAAEDALAAFRKPTIAAIDGYCVGGAWQIAGACDIRLASENAILGITPSKIGIVYPLSGIERLVRLVGPANAKYLLFSGDFVNAADSARLGLVARVLPVATFHQDVDSFAEHLSQRSQFSIQAQKDLVNAISAGAPDVGERNAYWQRQMALSPDAAAGVTAFLAKETPTFTWLRPAE
jgi:enoyl-CoA hydratase/carnithine racemase